MLCVRNNHESLVRVLGKDQEGCNREREEDPMVHNGRLRVMEEPKSYPCYVYIDSRVGYTVYVLLFIPMNEAIEKYSIRSTSLISGSWMYFFFRFNSGYESALQLISDINGVGTSGGMSGTDFMARYANAIDKCGVVPEKFDISELQKNSTMSFCDSDWGRCLHATLLPRTSASLASNSPSCQTFHHIFEAMRNKNKNGYYSSTVLENSLQKGVDISSLYGNTTEKKSRGCSVLLLKNAEESPLTTDDNCSSFQSSHIDFPWLSAGYLIPSVQPSTPTPSLLNSLPSQEISSQPTPSPTLAPALLSNQQSGCESSSECYEFESSSEDSSVTINHTDDKNLGSVDSTAEAKKLLTSRAMHCLYSISRADLARFRNIQKPDRTLVCAAACTCLLLDLVPAERSQRPRDYWKAFRLLLSERHLVLILVSALNEYMNGDFLIPKKNLRFVLKIQNRYLDSVRYDESSLTKALVLFSRAVVAQQDVLRDKVLKPSDKFKENINQKRGVNNGHVKLVEVVSKKPKCSSSHVCNIARRSRPYPMTASPM
mmetsp:Transcript_3807/g.5914  ORF Transcript_3807/g.5914 Transcript_3807/m.5914 type:complete len:542 (+) Transcript_3807:47-1672(+)